MRRVMVVSRLEFSSPSIAPAARPEREVARPGEDPVASTAPRENDAATDQATFSPEALALARGESAEVEDTESRTDADSRGEGAAASDRELSEEERRQVEKLSARDAEVRAHEAAHMAAGGSHVRGGASYSYQQGPDGKQYANGGEVGIDVSSVPNNPQATIQKMQQVRAAALAPADPSGADHAVAAKAAQTEAQAREQLAERQAGRVAAAYSGAEPSAQAAGSFVDATA
ncbi:MAG: hypothetical protein IAE82_07600 [Opitutaceae bacterium]|nr:hypothetical protein [Opitutaceae bacterium]